MSSAPTVYTPSQPIWCAGCGHYAVLNALRTVLGELELPPHEVVVLAGIGCSGTIQNYVGAYGYHALHGRVLPAATGVALANPGLTVVAAGGDGDGYAIGAGHLVHAFRRNPGLTYLLMNNETYGLTKGQASPGRFHGDEAGLTGTMLGLSVPSTTFVARGYSGRYDQLVRLTRAALEHSRSGRGFAFLEVISPCVTYADEYAEWEEALVDVDADPAYDASDRVMAFATATRLAAAGRLPAGLLFRSAPAPPEQDRPVPAHADIDPANPRYRTLLDLYAVREATPRTGPEPRVAPRRQALGAINAWRLPGQPAATDADLEADLGAEGARLWVAEDGAACTVAGEEGLELRWLYAPDDRERTRALVERAVGAGGGACVRAFGTPSAVAWGIPGLPAERRPQARQALLDLGFTPARSWRYLHGRPAPRASQVADQVRETAPNHWTLTVSHDDIRVAEARVVLGPGGRGMVRWIGVAEALRGRGMGRALFDQATHLLGSRGAGEVVLFVEEDPEDPGRGRHAPAFRLYAGAGLVPGELLCSYRRDPA